MSEYFRLMFDVGSADAVINVLGVNTTSDILINILQFMYRGTTDIHVNNVELLLKQSILMQLHQLSQLCIDFIATDLTIANVVQYFELSMSLQYEPLSMIIISYIRNHYRQLVSTGQLAELQIDTLKSLLAYMNIDDVDERIAFKISLHWVAAHRQCNEGAELLNAIKFNKLTIHDLRSVRNNPLLEQKHKLLIQESLNMKYELHLENQQKILMKHSEHLNQMKKMIQDWRQQPQPQQPQPQQPQPQQPQPQQGQHRMQLHRMQLKPHPTELQEIQVSSHQQSYQQKYRKKHQQHTAPKGQNISFFGDMAEILLSFTF